uniref:CSON001940 protein n=1 Tax=Culicoides sonorensis TaxID=179676 RepID=A0A336MLS7_CULSO
MLLIILKLSCVAKFNMNPFKSTLSNQTFNIDTHIGDSSKTNRTKFFSKHLNKMTVVKLNDINIMPHEKRYSVINLRQQFILPMNSDQNSIFKESKEKCTQTFHDCDNTQMQPKSSYTSFVNSNFEFQDFDVSVPSKRKFDHHYPSFVIQRPRPLSRASKSRASKMMPEYASVSIDFTKPISLTSNLMQIVPRNSRNEISSEVQEHNLASCDMKSYLDQGIYHLQHPHWESHLQGLQILLEISHLIDWIVYEPYLRFIGQRLIDLIKSPRTTIVCLTCQLAGDLFKATRCIKKPEYEELILLLQVKTGDANKIIRKHANIALDKMITFVSIFDSIKILTVDGPSHKCNLVRIATARLIVCVCNLASLDLLLGHNSCRIRIISALQSFLMDKNMETSLLF